MKPLPFLRHTPIPEISVLIYAREGGAPLHGAIAALRAQTLPAEAFEIVVLSKDELAPIADVRGFQIPEFGAAAAYNLGIFGAAGRIVVLLCEHTVPHRGFLAAILGAHQAHFREGAVVYGAVNPSAEQRAMPLLQHLTRSAPKDLWREPWCPISFKRTLLVNHGVFDTGYSDGWERVELIWRISHRRIKLTQAGDAEVTLTRAWSFAEECARRQRQGRQHALMAGKHSDSLMASFAQVGEAQALWNARKEGFDAALFNANALESEMASLLRAESPPPPFLKDALDRSYRDAFALCRAKGVSEGAQFCENV